MKKNENTRKVLLTVVIIAAAVAAGCRGPTGPAGPAGRAFFWVTGRVESATPGDTISDVEVYVGNSSGVPAVEVNGIRVDYRGIYEQSYWFRDNEFSISPGESARLSVTGILPGGGAGVAQASPALPGEFGITSHDTSAIAMIPLGSDLTVTWTSAAGADEYDVGLHLSYLYVDTLGDSSWFYCDADTALPDTSIVFPASQLFPDLAQIASVASSWGGFCVSALSEYPAGEGRLGNVTGDGIGFFYGRTYGLQMYLIVSGSTLLAPSRLFDISYEDARESVGRRIRKIGQ